MTPTLEVFKITETLIAPLTGAIGDALNLLVPVGITVMGSFIAIRLVKRIIFSFL
jgi:hypothetical protein